MALGFDFGVVYVRHSSFPRVRDALADLMAETDRAATGKRGLEPTPDLCTAAKAVRSFALMPEENEWIAILEDGHPLDDGGVAEGLSELLGSETLHFAYSDEEGRWLFERYYEGQPLEGGGSEDSDYDVSAMEFVAANLLPHFGVYYEEVAAASGETAPALAGSLGVLGEIRPRLPIGTDICTFWRPGKPPPA
ncbi:MAG: hypothetical protein GIW99_03860 [Candidatus Eremiobacteraeota bacterium]|nr:hypothetical protein [Candidatus Eremiobacteraeota bacterium]MBC5826808.1 hypothetical protein [Candidatus Eremiobacteraeota bacterium]